MTIELFYKDFFEPPARTKAPKAKKPTKQAADGPSTSKVRFHEEVRVKKIKAKGKNLPVNTMFYEEEGDEEDDDYEGEEGVELDDEDAMEGEEREGTDEEDEDEDEDEDSEEAEDISMGDEESEHGFATMERLKDDLFADDEEDPKEGAYI